MSGGWGGGDGAGGAWNLIAETILGAPAATVTFAAIPGTYRILALMAQVRTDEAQEISNYAWRANADGGNNYDVSHVDFDTNTAYGPVLAQASARISLIEGAAARADCFSNVVTYWHGYALADREKQALSDGGLMGNRNVVADLKRTASYGAWRSPAAITSLTYIPGGNNFVAGCYFALYGIT